MSTYDPEDGHCNSCDTWHDCDVAMRCLNPPVTAENGSNSLASLIKGVLQKALDRDWKNETLFQTAVISANAIHWRNDLIEELREKIRANAAPVELSAMLAERRDYWRNHDLHSGWTGSASGPCCEKCRMTSPKDPLQVLVGCRDPFQINCECHIPPRRAVRDYILSELNALIPVLKDGQLISDSGPVRK